MHSLTTSLLYPTILSLLLCSTTTAGAATTSAAANASVRPSGKPHCLAHEGEQAGAAWRHADAAQKNRHARDTDLDTIASPCRLVDGDKQQGEFINDGSDAANANYPGDDADVRRRWLDEQAASRLSVRPAPGDKQPHLYRGLGVDAIDLGLVQRDWWTDAPRRSAELPAYASAVRSADENAYAAGLRGAGSPLVSGDPGLSGITPAAAVPEPSSWLMLVTGLGALLLRTRLRQRRAAARDGA